MIPVARPVIDDGEIQEAIKVLKSGMYTSGEKVRKFENEFAKYIGVKYAVACNSGTAALHMALLALKDGPSYEPYQQAIVPPMSFFATISSVMMVDMDPVFVDVGSDCNIDPEYIEKAITPNTSVIIPVHFYGKPCDMTRIMEISRKYQIPVIEDCAQSHGAEWKGRKVGSFGECGCFSFFATKNMTTIEGGMITTDRPDIFEKCLLLRSHGMTDRDNHSVLGYNYRMNELSGAIGSIQLKKLDKLNTKRIENSRYLFENIKPHNGFSGQLIDRTIVPGHVYFWYPVFSHLNTFMAKDFTNYLKKNGIGFRQRYTEPLYKQPLFKGKYKDLNLHNAEKLSGTIIGLPNYAGLTKDDLDKVIEVVNSYGNPKNK